MNEAPGWFARRRELLLGLLAVLGTIVLLGATVMVVLVSAGPRTAVPAGLSDAEAREALVGAMADELRELGRRVPEVAVQLASGGALLDDRDLVDRYPLADGRRIDDVELVSDLDEWIGLQVACLREQGLSPVTVTPDGYLLGGTRDEALQARVLCTYSYPLDPRVLGALSAEQAGYAWDYFQSRLIPCLTGLGLRVGDGPSRDVFVREALGVAGPLPWTPYDGLRIRTDAARAALDAACAPLPVEPYALYERLAPAVLVVAPDAWPAQSR